MNLIDIYSMFQSNQLTEAEACEALGLTTQQFRSRLTKWGHRLPLLFSILDKIKHDQITRDEAASALNVTVRDVNKLCISWKVVRPVKEYLIQRTASKVKWEVRKKYAIDYIAGTTTLEDAAEAAEVSDRQMRRWVSDLLIKHFEMPWKDLATLTDFKRRRLANEIETAENLDLARQNIVNAISRGDKSIEEEALERVIAKTRKRKPHV